jgi:hypothetical protein
LFHTADRQFDATAVPQDAPTRGVDQSRWHFITDLSAMFTSSASGLMFAVLDNPKQANPDDFHSQHTLRARRQAREDSQRV